ncbi:MAG TPA: tetratricopeptide repeat protein, partial [Myxococcota bacterium]
IADLLEDEPHRLDELVDVLRVGSQHALSYFGKTGEARALLERLASVQQKAGRPEEAADAWVQVARLVPDEKNLERALTALDEIKRHKEAVALLEETAAAVADTGFRARTFLRAADIARNRLQKRGKARELVERALDLMPRDRAALRTYSELLIEIGDAKAAIEALERLAAEEPSSSPTAGRDRALIQLRIGRLIEEHLLKPDDALKRYRAAAEMDAHNKDAWGAIRTIARQRGDRALIIESLRGLAGAEPDLKERAALWRQIAKVERDERGDASAAEKAFHEALALDAGDVESLMGVAAIVAARLQPDVDLDASLAHPNDALLDALRAPVIKVPQPSTLPLSLRRLSAIALSRVGERGQATQRFDDILQETPDDLATLMALARHLAAAPRNEEGAEARRLRCLEAILLHHAYSLKPPVQVDVWGDVTALRAATGDGAGARKAAKKVMALAATDELRACLSDRAVRAVALALDDARDAERDPKSIIAALKLDSERSVVESEKGRLLERAAAVANEELKDRVLSRALLEDA